MTQRRHVLVGSLVNAILLGGFCGCKTANKASDLKYILSGGIASVTESVKNNFSKIRDPHDLTVCVDIPDAQPLKAAAVETSVRDALKQWASVLPGVNPAHVDGALAFRFQVCENDPGYFLVMRFQNFKILADPGMVGGTLTDSVPMQMEFWPKIFTDKHDPALYPKVGVAGLQAPFVGAQVILRQTILHEFGHFFGLWDTYNADASDVRAGEPASVMASVFYNKLFPDDVGGILASYFRFFPGAGAFQKEKFIDGTQSTIRLGLEFEGMYFGTGLLIAGVKPEGPSAGAGLTSGLYVLSANGQDINSLSDFNLAKNKASDGKLQLTGVDRRGKSWARTVLLPLAAGASLADEDPVPEDRIVHQYSKDLAPIQAAVADKLTRDPPDLNCSLRLDSRPE